MNVLKNLAKLSGSSEKSSLVSSSPSRQGMSCKKSQPLLPIEAVELLRVVDELVSEDDEDVEFHPCASWFLRRVRRGSARMPS